MIVLGLIGLLLFFLAAGIPVSFSLGLSSLVTLLFMDIPLSVVPQRILWGADKYTLLAIPFFILAGSLMDTGGITRRLVNFAAALVGRVRGGLSIVTVVTNMFMAGVSGSAAADASATGMALIPAMAERGYPKGFAAAVTAAASTIGPIIPPSVLFVVYGATAGVSIGRLFLAGAIPGVLMGVCLMIVCYFSALRHNFAREEKTSFRKIASTAKDAIPALVMPLIIVGGILGGIFTPTESAAVAVVYALFVGLFVYRELSPKDLPRILKETTFSAASIMFVIAAASLFAWILTREQVPQALVSLVTAVQLPPPLMLGILVILIILIGCFMDTSPMLIILVPVLMPMVKSMGLDPVHFGVIMVMSVCLGVITPPVGVSIYIVCGIAGITMEEYTKYLLPFLIALAISIFIITYWPMLSLILPNTVGGTG